MTPFTEGDIFYVQYGNDYHVFKLLSYDAATATYHVLIYNPMTSLPDVSTLHTLEIQTYHAPIAKDGFDNPTLLTNKPVTSADLIGYHEYLRQTMPPNAYIAIAKQYYLDAIYLTDEKKYEDAMDAYSKAIDLLPQFFEAIDNRAFCKMDLARWQDAIEDFTESLQVNPNSLLAEFSIGECYFRLNDFANAKIQFEKTAAMDPSHQMSKVFLKKTNEMLGK